MASLETRAHPTPTLAAFLLARIVEDYERERGDAPFGSMVEFAARLRANVRRLPSASLVNGRFVSYERTEAAKYADHPDYRPEWRP